MEDPKGPLYGSKAWQPIQDKYDETVEIGASGGEPGAARPGRIQQR